MDLVTSSDARFLQKDATEPATEVQAEPLMADALEALESELLQGWSKRLQEVSYDGKLTGVSHTRNDRPADVVEDQGTRVLFGQAYFYEELLGLRFRITPFSFFQTNSLGAEKLYETARDFITAENADILEGKTV